MASAAIRQTLQLTPLPHRRRITFVPTGFDEAFRRVKELVATFRANENIRDFYTNRCDGLDRQIDALDYDLYALTPAEIKIVEGAAR